MTLLSLDLALRKTGWAILKAEATVAGDQSGLVLIGTQPCLADHGVVQSEPLPKHPTLRDRAVREWQLFWAFLRLPWKGVTHVVYETPKAWMRASKKTSKGTIAGLYSAETILHLATVAASDAELHCVDPNHWQAGMLAGFPYETKRASVERAKIETGLDLSEDEADAVCLGVWWIRNREWEALGDIQGDMATGS